MLDDLLEKDEFQQVYDYIHQVTLAWVYENFSKVFGSLLFFTLFFCTNIVLCIVIRRI